MKAIFIIFSLSLTVMADDLPISQANDNHLFKLKKIGHDINHVVNDAGKAASVVSTGAEIAGVLSDDELRMHFHKILHDAGHVVQDAGKVASVADTGAEIASVLSDDELRLHFHKILHTVSKVAHLAAPIISVASDIAAFAKSEGKNADKIFLGF